MKLLIEQQGEKFTLLAAVDPKTIYYTRQLPRREIP
jgi:hypothetical protein